MKKSIDKFEEQIRLQELEINFLKEKIESISLSNDQKKAIKFETLYEANRGVNRKLLILIPIIGLALSVFGFFGYENIKTSILGKIDIQSLKNEVLIAAEKEVKSIERTSKKLDELEKKIDLLDQEVQVGTKKTESIIESLDPKLRDSIEEKLRNKYIKRLGISIDLIINTLDKEIGFSDADDKYDVLRSVVSKLQQKYNLVADGYIGPATSLLILSISINIDKNETLKSIRRIKKPFLSYPELCKEAGLVSILTNSNHSLHKDMIEVLTITDNVKNKEEVWKRLMEMPKYFEF